VHLTLTDVLVLIPVVPVLVLAPTWWLPWERWLKVEEWPARLLGPYLLYCAFAAWHFRLHWWAVLSVLAGGVLVTAWAAHDALTRKP
jgi:hypothetical protein